MKSHFIYIMLLMLAVIACKPESQSGVATPQKMLSEKEMLDILTEVQIANAAVERKAGANPDLKQKQRQVYLTAIFEKFKVEPTLFYENYNYYSSRPELMDTIYAQMKGILEKKVPIEEERMRKNPPPVPVAPPAVPVVANKVPALPQPVSGKKGGK